MCQNAGVIGVIGVTDGVRTRTNSEPNLRRELTNKPFLRTYIPNKTRRDFLVGVHVTARPAMNMHDTLYVGNRPSLLAILRE